MSIKNVLIVGAHYDDTELGVGGTAARLAQEGANVFKLTLTDNVTNFNQMGIHVDQCSSKLQSAKACQILGIREINDFDTVKCNTLSYGAEIMQRVESVLYRFSIDTVFMHFESDINQDHVEAARICLTAARHCDNLFQYQSNGYVLPHQFSPAFFVDISEFYEKKFLALEQYGEEHNRFDNLFQINLERNHLWGYGTRREYAEGFHVVKCVL